MILDGAMETAIGGTVSAAMAGRVIPVARIRTSDDTMSEQVRSLSAFFCNG
jgi:hypothetical protein